MAWMVMLVWWPWAQTSPLFNVIAALREIAHFKWMGGVFFKGQFFAATQIPWDYLPTWMLISLPEFYFFTLTIGVIKALGFVVNGEKTKENGETLVKTSMLIFLFCLPIISAIVLHSTIYDGMRQFLFVIPFLSILAGISFTGLIKSNCHIIVKRSVIALVGISLIVTIIDMLRLHPYQSIYFNRAVAGGMQSGAMRYETDYWGSAHREGAEWLVEHYQSDTDETIRVANCAAPFLSDYFFEKLDRTRERFVTVIRNDNPHVVLAMTRGNCHESIKGKILHIIERMNVPLLYIIEVIPHS
jgi:hypothetical protein